MRSLWGLGVEAFQPQREFGEDQFGAVRAVPETARKLSEVEGAPTKTAQCA